MQRAKRWGLVVVMAGLIGLNLTSVQAPSQVEIDLCFGCRYNAKETVCADEVVQKEPPGVDPTGDCFYAAQYYKAVDTNNDGFAETYRRCIVTYGFTCRKPPACAGATQGCTGG